jgi:rhodanese-related sulfurtransferase
VPKSITASDLERQRNGDAPPFMLDVREVEELEDGAIAGSVNIPMGEVEQRLAELPKDRDIVVICHLGIRSIHVAKRLNALGYARAVSLSGGMEAWLQEPARGARRRLP